MTIINNIQYLRAYAAIIVVLSHAVGAGEKNGLGSDALHLFDPWGSSGVDIFFVISGFVMFHTQRQGKTNATSFIVSRCIRIIPMYWLVTVCMFGLLMLLPSGIANSTQPTPKFLFESLFFLAGSLADQHPIVFVGWTLEWEMLFYIIFATTLFIRREGIRILAVTAAIAAICLVAQNMVALEFVIGMYIAAIYKRMTVGKGLSAFIFLLGSFLLIGTMFDLILPDQTRFLRWGLPAGLVVFGSVYASQKKFALPKLLGDASYSIYLIQVLIIPAFYKVLIGAAIGISGTLAILMCVGLVVAVGVALHIFAEKPMTTFLKALLARPRKET